MKNIIVSRYYLSEMMQACQELEARGFECIQKITKKTSGGAHFERGRHKKLEFKGASENSSYYAIYRRGKA